MPVWLPRLIPYLALLVGAAGIGAWLLRTGAELERARALEHQAEAAGKADEASRDYRRGGGAAERMRDGSF